ncbi:MAG: hypothetical protein TR69_WS6001000878 [candidate division WS6 bacterium OLB20]|uniref:Fido domain-containing protein n=1 Tax=candidate division WS6 bacterium OLB20 TaxID=1617426 RepID=A0A136LZ13_9BACT|nr:MAG: hypothetical protein TR69_WS6001000878 [candidate division WS6 bacterium OLB20]
MADPVRYIPPESLPQIFTAIEEYLHQENDPVAHYANERDGCRQLESVLERIQEDYYPDFNSKATYLFLSVNRGHFFSNGNKRLAATLLKVFYTLNDYHVDPDSLPELIIRTDHHTIDLTKGDWDATFFNGDAQMIFLYAIAVTVADEQFQNIQFDDWKLLVERLLQVVLKKT